jgi:hypothetical protein
VPTSDRAFWGSVGGYESWSRTEDRAARTAPARSKFLSRFDAFADPEAARKAYFLRLAAKSAQARKKRT